MKGPVEPVHRSVPETIQEVIELTGFLCFLFRSTATWQPTGVFSTPTLMRSYTKRAFLQARARRGSGRGLALSGAAARPTLLQRLARDEDEEEAESLADLHL